MRPLRLELQGFLSHRESTVLQLEHLSAVAIVGENGAGKTSLVEAISWALYGRGRGRGPDDFVSAGATSCRVRFEFELDGREYAVERQRQSGTNGKSALQLLAETVSTTSGAGALDGEDTAEPLSADAGSSPALRSWTPIGGDSIAETQAAIEQLLGMDAATYEATAYIGQGQADRFTELRPAERKALLAEVLDLSRYEELSAAARARTLRLRAEIEATNRRIGELQVLEDELPARRHELETATSERAVAGVETSAREDELNLARKKLEGARGNLADLEHVRGRLEELRASRTSLGRRTAEELARGEAHVSRLEQELSAAAFRLDALRERAASETAWRLELEEFRTLSSGLRTQDDQLQAEMVGVQRQGQIAEAATEEARRQITELAERAALLERSEGASCYACGQQLDPDLRERVHAETLEELGVAQAALRSSEASAASAREAASVSSAAIERLRMEGHTVGERISIADLGVRAAEQAAAEILGEEDRRSELDRDLADARRLLAQAREALKVTEQPGEEEVRLEERMQGLAHLEAAAREASATVVAADRALADMRVAELRAAERAARAEQALASLETSLSPLEDLRGEQEQLAEAAATHELLAEAFGRNGIPALVIETAVPQLEAAANDLLSRLTAGRFTVRIDTLAAKKTGGLRETLDITVGDDVSERPLEQLSGGERQCVDLALRIALSRLLAHRAGRSIETLVIDEGFTALDVAHKQRTIEVLHGLLEEFRCVLFVTHLVELADAFPTRIHVTRDGDGSRVQVLEGALV